MFVHHAGSFYHVLIAILLRQDWVTQHDCVAQTARVSCTHAFDRVALVLLSFGEMGEGLRWRRQTPLGRVLVLEVRGEVKGSAPRRGG